MGFAPAGGGVSTSIGQYPSGYCGWHNAYPSSWTPGRLRCCFSQSMREHLTTTAASLGGGMMHRVDRIGGLMGHLIELQNEERNGR